jgi:hypothetical protein
LSVINDPLGVFPSSAIRANSSVGPFAITLDVPVPSNAYYAQPYPCDVLVTTTGGTRLVRLAPPPVLAAQDITRLTAELLARVADCEQLVSPWFHEHKGYDPHWSVDPAFFTDVTHLWQVEVSGLPPG